MSWNTWHRINSVSIDIYLLTYIPRRRIYDCVNVVNDTRLRKNRIQYRLAEFFFYTFEKGWRNEKSHLRGKGGIDLFWMDALERVIRADATQSLYYFYFIMDFFLKHFRRDATRPSSLIRPVYRTKRKVGHKIYLWFTAVKVFSKWKYLTFSFH